VTFLDSAGNMTHAGLGNCAAMLAPELSAFATKMMATQDKILRSRE